VIDDRPPVVSHDGNAHATVLVVSDRALDVLLGELAGCEVRVSGPLPTRATEPELRGAAFDCAIVDLTARGTPCDALEWICTRTAVPVLVVTRLEDVASRLDTLRLGCADHVVAPYDVVEVIARVENLLARRRRARRRVLDMGNVTIDEPRREVVYAGQRVGLTGREMTVLATLMRQTDRVVSKVELLELLWPGEQRRVNAIEAHVSALRRKLDRIGAPIIHTVHGVGYVVRPLTPRSREEMLLERDRLLRERDEALARRDALLDELHRIRKRETER